MRPSIKKRVATGVICLSAAIPIGVWSTSYARAADTKPAAKSSKPLSKKDIKKIEKKIDTLSYEVIGDDTGADGLQSMKVEGVGLVFLPKDTGSNPPDNKYKQMVLDDMRRRDIAKPKELVESMDTAIVLLRGFIPPGARKGDMIDVEAIVPPGDTATSIRGGQLMEADLRLIVQLSKSKSRNGWPYAKVAGPIVVTTAPDSKDSATALRKGKILGGGYVENDRDVRIIFPQDSRNGRKSKSYASLINQRFNNVLNENGKPIASAKDDKMINLSIVKCYRYDIERFLQVVRKIPVSTSDTFRRNCVDVLAQTILNPAQAVDASIRLEAIGQDAIPALRDAMSSKSEIVRFCAAQSLAYLGDSSGVPELTKLAENSQEYRANALAALVALDQPVTRTQLAKLLNSANPEARYGAFRALYVYDKRDPVVAGENVQSKFFLHQLKTTSEPMIHIANNFRPEIVIFDDKQMLLPPFNLAAGDFRVNANADEDHIRLSNSVQVAVGSTLVKGESKLFVGDFIKEAARLGTCYTDIVDILQQASTKGNLTGSLEFNRLPHGVPLPLLDAYARREGDLSATKPGQAGLPGLFSIFDGQSQASMGDGKLTDPDEDESPVVKPKKKSFFDYFRRASN